MKQFKDFLGRLWTLSFYLTPDYSYSKPNTVDLNTSYSYNKNDTTRKLCRVDRYYAKIIQLIYCHAKRLTL